MKRIYNMEKELKKFYVLNWNINTDTIEHYDVLPYFRSVYEERVKDWKKKQKSKRFQKNVENGLVDPANYKAPANREELKKFILSESQYMFWARCEYEMICHGWPVQKNNHKLDIYEQIKMNLDIITDILFKEFYEC